MYLGVPPVLLWPEQQYSLQFKVSNSNNLVSNSKMTGKKRKRHGSQEVVPAPEAKLPKVGLLSRVLSILSLGLLGPPQSVVDTGGPSLPPSPPEKNSFSLELVPTNASEPVTASNDRHTLVYMDLVRRGYLVGPGHVYGGDYNIYDKGKDPSSSHSMATIRVLAKPTVSARDLISYARVQNQVSVQ